MTLMCAGFQWCSGCNRDGVLNAGWYYDHERGWLCPDCSKDVPRETTSVVGISPQQLLNKVKP